jgi:hypothetical protein
LGNFTAVRLDGPTVARLLAFLPTEVPALAGLLPGSSDGYAPSAAAMAVAKVTAASRLELRYSDDGGVTQTAVELATRSQGRFVAAVSVGALFFLEFEVAPNPAAAAAAGGGAAASGAAADAAASSTLHRVGVALTRPGAFSVFAHVTLASARAQVLGRLSASRGDSGGGGGNGDAAACANPGVAAATLAAAALAAGFDVTGAAPGAQAAAEESAGEALTLSRPVKVMTYNVWNLNPPAYVHKDAAARWAAYEQRLDQLARVILDQAPDVVALQEVTAHRWDWGTRQEFVHSGALPKKGPSREARRRPL